MYPIMKHLHMTLAFLTLFSFALRGIWMMRRSPLLHQRWVKIAPHIIDTLLLVTALILAGILRYNPGAHPWLMAKIIALVVYKIGRASCRESVRISEGIASVTNKINGAEEGQQVTNTVGLGNQ